VPTDMFCRLYRGESHEILWLEGDRLRLGFLPTLGARLVFLIDRNTGNNIFAERTRGNYIEVWNTADLMVQRPPPLSRGCRPRH